MTSAVRDQVEATVAALERLADPKVRNDMSVRYGNHSEKAFGIPMAAMQKIARELGTNHELAAALWETGWYEARIVAAYVDDPALVTPAQMDQWCREFDNWGICDTVCFVLFDRTPHAFGKVAKWARRRAEFEKRAAFALLASLALHDKKAKDEQFATLLPLVEKAAEDDRNFVKKGVSWALRSIGLRRINLKNDAVAMAQRLAESPNAAERWVGKDALRDLTKKRSKPRGGKKE